MPHPLPEEAEETPRENHWIFSVGYITILDNVPEWCNCKCF